MPMGVWYSAVLHDVRGFPYICVHLIQDVKVHRSFTSRAQKGGSSISCKYFVAEFREFPDVRRTSRRDSEV